MRSVGVIGSGFIAEQHLQSWRTIGVPVHVYGGSRTAEVANDRGARAHATLASLLAAVDVVDVCTPTDTHRDLVIEAARSGRDVICEKPLALHPAHAEEMIGVCAEEGRQLFVAHVVRYFPEYAALRARVSDGAIGTPAVIRLARESFAPRRPATHWMFDESRSGGIITDLMIHDLDFAAWVAGPVSTVFAKTARVASEGFDDHAFAILTHAGGALSHVTVSWAFPPPTFRTRAEIAGSTGLLSTTVDDAAGTEILFREPPAGDAEAVGYPSPTAHAAGDDPLTAELRDFLRAIEGDALPRVTAADALHAVAVAAAALTSSRTGRPCTVGGPDV